MGGRGASSGTSEKGNPYGSQYRTVLKVGNIKFLEAKQPRKGPNKVEPLRETMTPGRVYVRVAGGDLQEIVYFDRNNKKVKTINLDHPHEGMQPHVHHGYEHKENDGPKGATGLSVKERAMVDRVEKAWEDYKKRRG